MQITHERRRRGAIIHETSEERNRFFSFSFIEECGRRKNVKKKR